MSAEIINLSNHRKIPLALNVPRRTTFADLTPEQKSLCPTRPSRAWLLANPRYELEGIVSSISGRPETSRAFGHRILTDAVECLAKNDLNAALNRAQCAVRILRNIVKRGLSADDELQDAIKSAGRMDRAARAAKTRRRNRKKQ